MMLIVFNLDNQNMTTIYYIHYIKETKINEETVSFLLQIIYLTKYFVYGWKEYQNIPPSVCILSIVLIMLIFNILITRYDCTLLRRVPQNSVTTYQCSRTFITIFGVPFYVSQNSLEIWYNSNILEHIFSIQVINPIHH